MSAEEQQAEPHRPAPRLLPPRLFLIALLLMAGLGWWDPTQVLPGWWNLSGAVLIALGLALAISGSRQFAKAGTNIVPFTRSSALVTDGVFAHSRNPMYLGFVLVLAGAAVVLNAWSPWVVVAAFAGLLHVAFIRHEERLMAQTFGRDYLEYKARVRRWL